MAIEIIIYAIVAAGLVLWLKNILGTRHGEERQRPNPYMNTLDKTSQNDSYKDNIVTISAWNTPKNEQIEDFFASEKNVFSVANTQAQENITKIAEADKNFEISKFMNAIQDVFVYVVESFAEGDRETLKDLLSPNVYKAFDKAITDREKKRERMSSEITAFRQVEVVSAELKNKKASIMIRFLAEETTATYDADDQLIAGNPDRIHEMRDLWVFEREINSRDPRWIVTQTRDDLDGDNDTIPNA